MRSLAQQPPQFITLVSEGTRDDRAFIYYQNEFQDQVQVHLEPDSVTGRSAPRQLAATHPIWLQLANESEQYGVYAQLGDTIYIRMDRARPLYYSFRSPKSQIGRQAELNFFNTLKQRGLAIELPDYVGLSVNARYPRQAEQFCRKFDQRRTWLQHQQDSLQLSPTFVGYASQLMQAQYFAALFYPYWGQDRAFNQFPASYAQLLAASGASRFFTADALVYSSPKYRSAVMGYLHYLSRDSVGTAAELATLVHHARTALQGRTRDYTMFFLLKQNLGKHLSTYDQYLSQFRHDCATPAYVHYLDSVAARPALLRTRPELAATPLRSSTGETLTWAQFLTRNQGKVLYLDLWASWCGPCLAEMPASAKLQQTLAGQAVQFVYFSIDRDTTKWHQALATHQLARPGTQHYLLDPNSALAKFLNAPPIPRYILLDKQGQVLALDAARPSDSVLVSDLTRALR